MSELLFSFPERSSTSNDHGYLYRDVLPSGSASDEEKQILIGALVAWMRKASWFAGSIGQRLQVTSVDVHSSPDGDARKRIAEVECEVAVLEGIHHLSHSELVAEPCHRHGQRVRNATWRLLGVSYRRVTMSEKALEPRLTLIVVALRYL